MQDLSEGLRLAGRYTLQRRIGDGGMAEIWMAEDTRSDSPLALKFLKLEFCNDPRLRALFHQEWRLASRLMHAHIVHVFEYHDDAERPYFGQQYIDGPPFASLQGQALDQVLRPIGLIADALRYAHGKGIVHSDLTSANIRLDARGAPYLLDFGVARQAGDVAGGGSPIAQSPQQRAGAAAHPADDIYALGVLINELLSGAPPVGGDLAIQTSAGEKIPTSLRELLRQMLADDRSTRPSAEAVADRLQTLGFASGAALLKQAAATSVPEFREEIAVRAVRPRAAAAAQAQNAADNSRGIPTSFVMAGLAVLLLAFLAVLFLLPPAEQTASDSGQVAAVSSPDGTIPSTNTDQLDDESASFSENVQRTSSDNPAAIKAAADEALGDLLSQLERLKFRGVERWGGQEFLDALDRYAAGDASYIAKNYQAAGDHYRATSKMLEPFFARIPVVFRDTMQAAREAFERQDHREAIRLFDLAVAITPGNAEAETGLQRAQNLERILQLMDRGREFEKNLEYDAARQAFATVLEVDPAWQPATEALARVRAALEQLAFEMRMTEGFNALAGRDYDSARAAFEAAKSMRPGSSQPVDGLQQLDQEIRLQRIRQLESLAASQEQNEQWEAAVESYREALSVDGDLQFAQEGLSRANERTALHQQLDKFISDPDSLSAPQTMQAATNMLLQLSRISPSGPRLEDQKESLSRLLKRAATPLPVKLVSDNQTEVSIFRVGRLGSFESRQLELRPGSYVATGSRPGYRDVRLEFRVAPELEMKPIIVRCEETI